MAPRSASRCCRAVRSRLANPSTSTSTTTPSATEIDGIWITDLVLASAFAHYCRISSPPTLTITTRRFAGNVPGPLESRRRMGKRHMTDQLSSQLPLGPGGSPLPDWCLPNAPDLRDWTWYPPRRAPPETTEESVVLSRQTKEKTSRGRRQESSASILPAWLTGFGNWPPAAEETSMADSIEPRQRSIAAQLLFTKLEAWHESIPTLSAKEFIRQLDDICRELQPHISLSAMTVDESREMIGLVWKGLVVKEAKNSLEASAAKLYATVLEGVRTCRLLKASDYGVEFWRDLFVYISQMVPGGGGSSISSQLRSIALDTLLATPPQFLAGVADLLPQHLCAVFANQNVATHTSMKTLDTSEAAAASSVAASLHILTRAQVQEIAEALAHIDLGQHGNFIDATTELLVASLENFKNGGADAGIPVTNHTTVASSLSSSSSSTIPGWLLTLAHMPSVRQDCLFKTMSQLQSSASQARVETTQAVTTAETTQTTQTTQSASEVQGQPQEPVLTVTNTETELLATTVVNSNANTNTNVCHGHLDLCELLITQWISRGYVTQQVRRSFEKTMAALASQNKSGHSTQDHPGALAALALAVFWPKHSRGQCVALYMSLLRGLQEKLGREAPDVLVESLNALLATMQAAQSESSPDATMPKFPPNTFYESLAWAADDLETAVRLHELYVATLRLQTPPPAQPFWNLSFWDRFASRLDTALDAGSLSPGEVSHALDLIPRSRLAKSKSVTTTKAMYKPAKELGEDTVCLVEKLAVHFALAPNLVPRRALRGVELCHSLLASNSTRKTRMASAAASPASSAPSAPSTLPRTPTSTTALRALFHLVTRDLDDSMPGRTSRLRWFLAVVARERGEKAALGCERSLERWRNAVKEHNRIESSRVREEDRKTLAQLENA